MSLLKGKKRQSKLSQEVGEMTSPGFRLMKKDCLKQSKDCLFSVFSPHHPDPSLTVRADIIGKYANRKYTYELGDVDFLAENMMKAKILLENEHEGHEDL
ncbi:hypothetical protein cypCar_00020405 [Cyprinus carpio]|nr:hypothetical protein cypCar_00020405 [Cyprinus carpio]